MNTRASRPETSAAVERLRDQLAAAYPREYIDLSDVMLLVDAFVSGEPAFITAMIDERRERYALDQSCTPAFLHWLDTMTPRQGVGANEAWNAGVEWQKSQALASPALQAEPVPDINGKPATAHSLLAALVDIYDDGQNAPPEYRCYDENAWREVLTAARNFLATMAAEPVAPAKVRPEFAQFVDTPEKRFLYDWGRRDGYQDGYAAALVAGPVEGAEPALHAAPTDAPKGWHVVGWRCKSPTLAASNSWVDTPEQAALLRVNGWQCTEVYEPLAAQGKPQGAQS